MNKEKAVAKFVITVKDAMSLHLSFFRFRPLNYQKTVFLFLPGSGDEPLPAAHAGELQQPDVQQPGQPAAPGGSASATERRCQST
jgi:hypothetical protein